MDRNRFTAVPEGSMVLDKNNFDVKGRYYIVSGGAQGLGRGIARRLAENGAEGITICDLNDTKGEKVKKELEQMGVKNVVFVKVDLTKEDDIKTVVVEAEKLGDGRVDGLINVAGASPRATLEQATVQDWDAAFSLNVRAAFLLTKYTAEIMKRKGKGGAVINISSIHSHCGGTELVCYASAKAALNCLTKNNAVELAPHFIRVNAIVMGWCLTDAEDERQKQLMSEDWLDKVEKAEHFKRILRVDDIANLVGFLISDPGSMITGTAINIHPGVVV